MGVTICFLGERCIAAVAWVRFACNMGMYFATYFASILFLSKA